MSDVPPPPPGSGPPPPPPPGGLTPPPGYAAYGTAPTPMTRVSRIGGLSMAIVILVAIGGVSGVINALLQTSLTKKADDFLAGTISQTEFEDSVVSFSAISALSGVALVAGAIVVMIWMYRITSNLRAYGNKTTWHPLFAVFGWFLPPLVLYVIPFLMLREQWKLSKPAGPAVTSANSGENRSLWVWFVCFGLLPIISIGVQFDSVGGNLSDTGAEAVAQRLQDANETLTLVTSVGALVAAIAWILFVRQLTARHRTLTGEN